MEPPPLPPPLTADDAARELEALTAWLEAELARLELGALDETAPGALLALLTLAAVELVLDAGLELALELNPASELLALTLETWLRELALLALDEGAVLELTLEAEPSQVVLPGAVSTASPLFLMRKPLAGTVNAMPSEKVTYLGAQPKL
jgi:hypothetical protein